MSVRHESFAPHVDAETRLVILGSLPGGQSLAAQQYYAHPRNQFWRLLESVFGEPLVALDYDNRLAALSRLRIGLWDVIASAERKGSLDSAIKKPEAQSLHRLISLCPKLTAIAFNGAKSAALGRRVLGEGGDAFILDIVGAPQRTIRLIDLPSSSAAYTLAFANKYERWAELAPYAGKA
jgi:hypoxanthine-DNA glycosylase